MDVIDPHLETTAEGSSAFAPALRSAIGRSRFSLDRLVKQLADRGHSISRTTLSQWQRGTTLPKRRSSLAALGDLERLLALGPGDLSGLLAPAARTAVSSGRSAASVSLNDEVRLGPGGAFLSYRGSHVIRAGADGADRSYFCASFDDADLVVELPFGRRVLPGESHLLEYTVDLPAGGTVRRWRRVIGAGVHQMLLRLRFDPAWTPTKVEACQWHADDVVPLRVERVPLQEGHVHWLLTAPAPGIYGFRWEQ